MMKRKWAFIPTSDNTPEFGGRAQILAGKGELGFSFHHRTVDLSEMPLDKSLPAQTDIPEDRFAVDEKWDIGIGVCSDKILHGFPIPGSTPLL
ncbi:MAG: hypothetical protein ACOC5T_03425 [Elusimicrobiota bacterium]